MTPQDASMEGKVCLVTGSTAGIGLATATGLAGLGAVVAVLGRDEAKVEVSVSQIKAQTGNQSVEGWACDLSSQESIRAFAARFAAAHPQLAVLVCNAHVYFADRHETPDGLEAMFAVNYLSGFLLTHLLLDQLKAAAPSRVVVVSDEWRLVKRAGIDFDDLQAEKQYQPVHVHNQAKVATFYFTHELAKRLEGTGVTANCLYPGHVDTGLKGDVPWFTHVVYPAFKRLGVLKTPAEGAQSPIYLASSPDVDGMNGRHFEHNKPVEPSHIDFDEAISERLWEVSSELAKVR